MKKLAFLIITLALFTFFSCELETEDTYYCEIGGVSSQANSYFTSNPGISANDMKAYCNQHPLSPDPYKKSASKVTRTSLENDLDDIKATGFSKADFLHALDTTGAVFATFIRTDGDIVYYYVTMD